MKGCTTAKHANTMTQWYAVYTRTGWEKKVTEGFSKRKWPWYRPLCPATAPRQRLGLRPAPAALFPSYVFVRLDGEGLGAVKRVEGVRSVVHWLGRPALIREEEIEGLRRFLSVHREVRVEKTGVAPGGTPEEKGAGRPVREGGVVSVDAVGSKLLLPSLGCKLTATHPGKQNVAYKITNAHEHELVKIN